MVSTRSLFANGENDGIIDRRPSPSRIGMDLKQDPQHI